MRVLLPSLFLALAACGQETPKDPAPKPAASAKPEAGKLDRSFAGTPAPYVAFQNPDGEPVTFEDFKGKPLLVNFWATWCAPCIVEMPTLDALAAREPGLQVLAISQDLEGREKVNAFFAERGFKKLRPYLDPELALATELKVQSLPMTILYDGDGREVWRVLGIEDWTGPRAAERLREAGGLR